MLLGFFGGVVFWWREPEGMCFYEKNFGRTFFDSDCENFFVSSKEDENYEEKNFLRGYFKTIFSLMVPEDVRLFS